MNTFTGIAIDAFRRQEFARRRLVRAEATTAEKSRLVPEEEFALYFAHTELIRFEMDRREAEDARDQDAVEACDRLIVHQREVIARIEGAPVR